MYTIKQLKKMATERIHKIYVALYNEILFNPYEEREYMMVAILGSQMTDDEIKGTEERAIVTPEFNEETQSVGIRAYHPLIHKIFDAIRNQLGLNPDRPVGMKGRKPRFNKDEVLDMLHCSVGGASVSDIARYYETSYAVVLQILEGRAYNWASGIPQNGNE